MTNFNSIKVQLELSVPPVKGKYFDFNSIKVQLEPGSHQGFHDCHEFQFHKGTIRTGTPAPNGLIDLYFNSIKVQLERVNSPSGSLLISHFNSIKVQLEPVNP